MQKYPGQHCSVRHNLRLGVRAVFGSCDAALSRDLLHYASVMIADAPYCSTYAGMPFEIYMR